MDVGWEWVLTFELFCCKVVKKKEGLAEEGGGVKNFFFFKIEDIVYGDALVPVCQKLKSCILGQTWSTGGPNLREAPTVRVG